jgi:hypothetical protein
LLNCYTITKCGCNSLVPIHSTNEFTQSLVKSLVENPPFCNCIFNYCSTTNIIENDKNNYKLFFATRKCFSQLQTSKVDKYKSKVSLQSKVYATCQHHNNSHYVPLLTNLVENCSTNIVEGCCQLHLINGWTSFAN